MCVKVVHWVSNLTLSWRRFLLCRDQYNDLLCKSIDWFLYGRNPRHEWVKFIQFTDTKRRYLKVHDQNFLHPSLLKAGFQLPEEFLFNLSAKIYHEYCWKPFQLFVHIEINIKLVDSYNSRLVLKQTVRQVIAFYNIRLRYAAGCLGICLQLNLKTRSRVFL